jgi:membrane protease YdiL (CAAX protease family)
MARSRIPAPRIPAPRNPAPRKSAPPTGGPSSGGGRFGRWLGPITAYEPAPPWSLRSAVLTVVFSIAAMFIGTAMALAWFEGQPAVEHVGWLIGLVLMTVYVLQTRRRPEDRAALRLGAPETPFFLLAFLALGAALTVDVISAVIDGGRFLPIPEMLYARLDAGLAPFVVTAAFMIVAQPVGEELVFRGVLYPALGAFGGWARWLASSIAFAAFHALIYAAAAQYETPGANLWHAFGAPLVLGLLCGWVRARTGSTRAAIIVHAAFGVFAVAKAIALSG